MTASAEHVDAMKEYAVVGVIMILYGIGAVAAMWIVPKVLRSYVGAGTILIVPAGFGAWGIWTFIILFAIRRWPE